jgi:hypothetical protein
VFRRVDGVAVVNAEDMLPFIETSRLVLRIPVVDDAEPMLQASRLHDRGSSTHEIMQARRLRSRQDFFTASSVRRQSEPRDAATVSTVYPRREKLVLACEKVENNKRC